MVVIDIVSLFVGTSPRNPAFEHMQANVDGTQDGYSPPQGHGLFQGQGPSQDQLVALASHATKVQVDDIPPHLRKDSSLIKYYLMSLTSVDCHVKQYGRSFLATFCQPIGIYNNNVCTVHVIIMMCL